MNRDNENVKSIVYFFNHFNKILRNLIYNTLKIKRNFFYHHKCPIITL